jgi:multidrug efflux pump subunit AcrA (membrane-fusion protein)
MNNSEKKRGWIKNAAIIFLAVMLVLTFFSNTIMNWSLPEVSGQYAGYGTITSSIRGTGTVEANMAYNVQLEETQGSKIGTGQAGRYR